MQTENDNIGCIRMSLLDVKSLLPEAKDRIEEKAILHDKYWEICNWVMSGGNVDKSYVVKIELLCWKNRVYDPQGLQKKLIHS